MNKIIKTIVLVTAFQRINKIVLRNKYYGGKTSYGSNKSILNPDLYSHLPVPKWQPTGYKLFIIHYLLF